jgi:hypothetical protein
MSGIMRWVGYATYMRGRRMHTGFWRPLGTPIFSWEDNIKIKLKERGWGGTDWSHLARDEDQWQALVNMVMSLCVP